MDDIIIDESVSPTIETQEDGSVTKSQEAQVILESYTQENIDELTRELISIESAILDIDNFKARRIANLQARKAEIIQIKGLL